ncbi:MAG: 5-carboxymethyl-2-hydroxymuconate isomerase [Candidatus Muproteobacteria bacterium RBG_16_62_13]|uniref:5-carboxymethyl-2-hydroxymuconate isomerase n=1 Tax=Candidatus Muproteobacteria bacterium RBG_16_62_13 TaxID=1817756 RepID=A0A1F6SXM7_9PROT|nr:MAG: 5-carboxymethyl-2-hydroxymuconate isomerase [Candidatus Muproteobacteria bacterium RBG_16_62_13]
MQLVTFDAGGTTGLGIVENDSVLVSDPGNSGWASVAELIAAGPDALARLKRDLPNLRDRRRLDALKLLAPIPRPRKNIMCLGWNYAEHVSESAGVTKREHNVPTDPIVFTKCVTSVIGPGGAIPLHASVTQQLDWEVELAVVIGRGGRDIPKERALDHVFGYTIINDVSARDVQFRHKQYFLGKSLDGTCPMGPWIVTADEIPDPQALRLQSRVNDVGKQDANTRDMVFDVATIIATLSRGMTLEPGDVIATGTPSGVGFARTPPEFLKAGDVVECEIEKIGVLRNPVA